MLMILPIGTWSEFVYKFPLFAGGAYSLGRIVALVNLLLKSTRYFYIFKLTINQAACFDLSPYCFGP